MIVITDRLTFYCTSVLAILSTILEVFVLFVVIQKSPPTMGKYRYALIISLGVYFEFSLLVGVLARPIPLPGAYGAQITGLLAEVWPSAGNILCPACSYSLCFQVMTVVGCFMCQEYILLHQMESVWDKHLRVAQIMALVVLFCSSFPFVVLISTPDQETRAYMEQLGFGIRADNAVWLIHPNKIHVLSVFLLDTAVLILLLVLYIIKSLTRILNTLQTNRSHLSLSTVRLHRMLVRALIWQSAVPLIFLVTPGVFMMSIVYVLPMFSITSSTPQMTDLTALTMFTPSIYTPVHLIAMLYFTTPYKNYCIRLFGLEKKKPRPTRLMTVSALKHDRAWN